MKQEYVLGVADNLVLQSEKKHTRVWVSACMRVSESVYLFNIEIVWCNKTNRPVVTIKKFKFDFK